MDTKLYFTKEDVEKLKSTNDTRLKTMAESVAKQAETAMECHIMRSCENMLEYQKGQKQKSEQN